MNKHRSSLIKMLRIQIASSYETEQLCHRPMTSIPIKKPQIKYYSFSPFLRIITKYTVGPFLRIITKYTFGPFLPKSGAL